MWTVRWGFRDHHPGRLQVPSKLHAGKGQSLHWFKQVSNITLYWRRTTRSAILSVPLCRICLWRLFCLLPHYKEIIFNPCSMETADGTPHLSCSVASKTLVHWLTGLKPGHGPEGVSLRMKRKLKTGTKKSSLGPSRLTEKRLLIPVHATQQWSYAARSHIWWDIKFRSHWMGGFMFI